MDQKIQEFLDILYNVDRENTQLRQIASFYQAPAPTLTLHGKFTAYDESSGKYIRCEPWYAMRRRTLLVYEAMKVNISEIFLPETVVFNNDSYGISSQVNVPLWNKEHHKECIPEKILYGNQVELSARLNEDYHDKYNDIYDFFEKFQIQGISGENAGIGTDGKLKIFDWFGNYAITSRGEVAVDGNTN